MARSNDWSWPVTILWVQGGVFLLAGALALVEGNPLSVPTLGGGVALLAASQVIQARPPAAPAVRAPAASFPDLLTPPTARLPSRRDRGDLWLFVGVGILALSWVGSSVGYIVLANAGLLLRNFSELQSIDGVASLGEGLGFLLVGVGWVVHYRPRGIASSPLVPAGRRAVARGLGGAGALAAAVVVGTYAAFALGHEPPAFAFLLQFPAGYLAETLAFPLGAFTLAVAWFIGRPRYPIASAPPPAPELSAPAPEPAPGPP